HPIRRDAEAEAFAPMRVEEQCRRVEGARATIGEAAQRVPATLVVAVQVAECLYEAGPGAAVPAHAVDIRPVARRPLRADVDIQRLAALDAGLAGICCDLPVERGSRD